MDADLESLTTRAARADAPEGALTELARALVRAGLAGEVRARVATLLSPGEVPASRAADYLGAVLTLGECLGDPRGALAPAHHGAYLHPDARHLLTTGALETALWDLETSARLAHGPGWGVASPGGFPDEDPRRVHRVLATGEGLTLEARRVDGSREELGVLDTDGRPEILAIRPDASQALVRIGTRACELALPGWRARDLQPPAQGSVGQAWVPVGACATPGGGWVVEWVELPPANLRRLRSGSMGAFRGAAAAALTHDPSGNTAPLEVGAAELAQGRRYRPRPSGAVSLDGTEFAHLITVDNADGREVRLFALPELELRDTVAVAGPVHDSEGQSRRLDPLPVYLPDGALLVQSGAWLARIDPADGAVRELPSPGLAPPEFLAPRPGGLVAAGPCRVTPCDPGGAPTRPVLVHGQRLEALASSRQGDALLTADLTGEVACWDLRAGRLRWQRPLAAGLGHLSDSPFAPDLRLGFSPEGSCALVWRQGQALCLDAVTGERRRGWSSHPNEMWSAVALGPEGRSLLCSELHQGVHLLGPKGEVEVAAPPPRRYLSHVGFLLGGTHVATLGGDGFCLRDAATLEVRVHRALPPDHLDLRIWPSLHRDPQHPRAYAVGPTGEVFALAPEGVVEVEDAFDAVDEAVDLAFASASPRVAIRANAEGDVVVVDRETGHRAGVALPATDSRAPFALGADGAVVWVLTGATATAVPVPALEPARGR